MVVGKVRRADCLTLEPKNEGDRITNHPLYLRAAAQIMFTPT